MSFGEKVKARLDALERRVADLELRLREAQHEPPAVQPAHSSLEAKRGPGRPRKGAGWLKER